MRERNPLHIALGVLGLLGALLYVLACRPAWSPDSSKVLFTYSNEETELSGIALYDRNTGVVRSIFSCKPGGGKVDIFPSATWSDDGSRVIILWEETKYKKRKNPATGKRESFETNVAHVEVLPLGRVGKKLHVKLRHFEPDAGVFLFPLVEAEGNLYLSDDDKRTLLQLDLKSGKQRRRILEDDREEPLLYSHDGHVAYLRGSGEKSDDLEFGELDPKDLSLHSRFVLKEKAVEAQGVSDIEGLPVFEPNGNRMAMPAIGQDKKARILMCNRRGLEQILKPELPNPASRLVNLEWARDGRTLYAAVLTPTEKKDISQLSLGEIPLAGGPVRLTPIVRASVSLDDAENDLQISISPDGSTIGASTAHFDKGKIDPADHGLFLVDLRDPARKVTRIHYPPVTGKKDTARK